MPNGDGTQMRVALQPAYTKLQAGFAMSVVVILVLRGLSLRVRIYVMALGRTTAGISKRRTEEDWLRNWGHRCVAASLCEDGGELSRVSWLGPPRGLIGANFDNI